MSPSAQSADIAFVMAGAARRGAIEAGMLRASKVAVAVNSSCPLLTVRP
jgi:hypothetical protein